MQTFTINNNELKFNKGQKISNLNDNYNKDLKTEEMKENKIENNTKPRLLKQSTFNESKDQLNPLNMTPK